MLRGGGVKMSRPIIVPFKLSDVHGGLGEGDGMAEVDASGLTLRFETRDAFLGALRSGAKETRIPLEEVSSVEATSGPFGGYLTIVTSNFAATTSVPGSRHGQIRLRIPRAGREAAEEAASLLNRRLAEVEIEGFKRELDEKDGGVSGLPGGAG